MEVNKPYFLTKDNPYFLTKECKQLGLEVGDYIWISENGDLNVSPANEDGGFIPYEEWSDVDVDCEASTHCFINESGYLRVKEND